MGGSIVLKGTINFGKNRQWRVGEIKFRNGAGKFFKVNGGSRRRETQKKGRRGKRKGRVI